MELLLSAGTVLGDRYSLERELGRGGMAHVFLARDVRQHRRVAVKILRPEIAAALGPERFLREIDIASRLTHPHILAVYDSGEADGLLYYVMPFVEGESLRERLAREGRLPLDDALAIAREVADALAYAHRLDVVHRDIKPGNVLFQAGHAVVADFGIARAITAAADERTTSSGLIVGTPIYMSPEQSTGEPLDARTDLYSLGCVAYEMLTGAPPILGETPQEVVSRHRTMVPQPVRTLRPEVPAPVAAAVERALAKRPEDRQPDARAFADALRAPGGWEPSARAPGRWLALLLILALAAGVIFLVRSEPSGSAASPVEIVVLPFEGDTAGSGELFAELIGWIPGLHAADPGAVLPEGKAWPELPLADLLDRARRSGARYLLAGTVRPGPSGRRVTVDLFATGSGERVSRGVDSAVGPLAAAVVGAVAGREGMELGSAGPVLACTTVLPAVGHMLQGQRSFWANDLDAAAAELRAAVEADSSCGLAYLRLSVVQAWRHDYPAALAAVHAGLGRAATMPARWVQLLRAQRYLVLGHGDSAIASYQSAVLDRRDDVDGWLGLGEGLVHYAGFVGVAPRDARPAFERMAALDSAFAPVYYHLVDLAVYAGDKEAATAFLRRMLPDHPFRPAKVAEVRLRFGNPEGRTAALAELRAADRQAISEAVIAWSHGRFALDLADTAAGFLLGADRVPDDRLRGAQYRLATRAAGGKWSEGYAAWDSVARSVSLDPWLIQALLAGHPAEARAAPMFEWARAEMRAGRVPDFTLPPWDERRQGFEALVYRAFLQGDSSETLELHRRIESAAPAPPTEPAADALRWTLRARLALLARDTTAAIAALQRVLARVPERYTANYPLTAAAPQRLQLARLLHQQGDSVGAERWRNSFRRSWSVADLFYLAAVDSLAAGSALPRPRSTP